MDLVQFQLVSQLLESCWAADSAVDAEEVVYWVENDTVDAGANAAADAAAWEAWKLAALFLFLASLAGPLRLTILWRGTACTAAANAADAPKSKM